MSNTEAILQAERDRITADELPILLSAYRAGNESAYQLLLKKFQYLMWHYYVDFTPRLRIMPEEILGGLYSQFSKAIHGLKKGKVGRSCKSLKECEQYTKHYFKHGIADVANESIADIRAPHTTQSRHKNNLNIKRTYKARIDDCHVIEIIEDSTLPFATETPNGQSYQPGYLQDYEDIDEEIDYLLSQFSKRDQCIAEDILNGYPFRDIADVCGVTIAHIRKIKKQLAEQYKQRNS